MSGQIQQACTSYLGIINGTLYQIDNAMGQSWKLLELAPVKIPSMPVDAHLATSLNGPPLSALAATATRQQPLYPRAFHGPTLAFKDLAMQLLARFMAHALLRRGQHATIIGATSGDTGAAAIEAFRGLPNIDVVIFYPHGRVSEVQRRQMTSVEARTSTSSHWREPSTTAKPW